jgi:hypothetical protein
LMSLFSDILSTWPNHLNLAFFISSCTLSLGKGPPGTHWIGGWVGLRAGLDTEAGGKSLCFC